MLCLEVTENSSWDGAGNFLLADKSTQWGCCGSCILQYQPARQDMLVVAIIVALTV